MPEGLQRAALAIGTPSAPPRVSARAEAASIAESDERPLARAGGFEDAHGVLALMVIPVRRTGSAPAPLPVPRFLSLRHGGRVRIAAIWVRLNVFRGWNEQLRQLEAFADLHDL